MSLCSAMLQILYKYGKLVVFPWINLFIPWTKSASRFISPSYVSLQMIAKKKVVSRLIEPLTSIKRALDQPPAPNRKHRPSPRSLSLWAVTKRKKIAVYAPTGWVSLRVGFCWLHPSGVHFLASNQLGDPEGVRGNSLSSHDALCCKYLTGRVFLRATLVMHVKYRLWTQWDKMTAV